MWFLPARRVELAGYAAGCTGGNDRAQPSRVGNLRAERDWRRGADRNGLAVAAWLLFEGGEITLCRLLGVGEGRVGVERAEAGITVAAGHAGVGVAAEPTLLDAADGTVAACQLRSVAEHGPDRLDTDAILLGDEVDA